MPTCGCPVRPTRSLFRSSSAASSNTATNEPGPGAACFFSSRRRHTRCLSDWSSDVCSSDLVFVTHEWHIPSEVIAPRRNRNGSGLVRRLAESARNKGAQILLKHEMTQIVRDPPKGGKVRGIVAKAEGKDIAIEARKGIVIATGGHTG